MTAPALSEFESLVHRIMAATSCSREKAEQAARLNRPELAPDDAVRIADLQRTEEIREKIEQGVIYSLFRGYGFKVRNLSQARATKQAPGLGDAWVAHRDRPIAFWWESKRQIGGKLSPAQIEMRDDCVRCGVLYRSGDRNDAARFLVQLGLARVGDGPCGIVPFHDGR